MRFLADENFPRASIQLLRDGGHDVRSVQEATLGASDIDVLHLARAERRTLLTFDRDFGSLVFVKRIPPPPAVILFRFEAPLPDEPARVILRLLAVVSIEGFFTSVGSDFVRQRRLP